MMENSITCSAILVGAIATCVSASAQDPPPFDRIVVFGDSLSDTGNAGRFSNGPVWVEQLAARLEIALRPTRAGGLNFAVGGARLDPLSGPHSLRAQADLFLGMRQPSGRTLHIVYGGGNDLLSAVNHLEAPRMVQTAVASLRSIVADLVAHGASDLLVPNLPDVGMTPKIRARGSTAVAHAGWLTQQFNGAADRALSALAGSFGTVRLYRLDVRDMAARARSNPAAFGFVDIKNPCSGLPACEGYLFWDGVHPTTQAHGRLADAALEAMSFRVKR